MIVDSNDRPVDHLGDWETNPKQLTGCLFPLQDSISLEVEVVPRNDYNLICTALVLGCCLWLQTLSHGEFGTSRAGPRIRQ